MASFEFDGIDDLERMFEQIGADIEQADKKALKAGGQVIANKQIELVNRSGKDQAHMQDNIRVSAVKEAEGGKFVEVGPNKKVAWRAKFLEFGTSKMPPYPFVEKGADEGEAEAIRAIERVYLDVINR
ncbi:HK97-gp10 family putative phage morphogenesis protein [Metabacillus fastidiosus]|uniref:HK97-gp10 family putative phage morphogenesis protein n=1 Tax=Metabacillus fastidiosus TaxID=1458 RepID=UPI003D29B1EC